MGPRAAIDVGDVVGTGPVTRTSILVLVLSFIVIMVDGYDLLCLSFVAPALAKQLQIEAASFGPIFSAGYIGMLIGGLALSPLSDKFGRKGVLLAAVTVFGLFSLLPIFDLSYERLLVYRFITGLGLGSAMPSAVALTAEYAPRRYRGLFVNLMFAGVATGGVLGGFLASRLIPVHGWQAAFWIGGVAPLIVVPVLAWLMPESITYLAATGKRPEYIARVLNRIDAGKRYSAEHTYMAGEFSDQRAGGILELLRGGRMTGTLLLWLAAFCALFTFGLTVSWLPAILTDAGLPLQTAILGPVVLNLGGILGTIALGLLFSRLGPTVIITASMALAAVGIGAMGRAIGVEPKPMMLSFLLAGGCLMGSINSINALMAAFYPVKIRATGVGWALGMGRVGGIIGPAIGGVLLSMQLSAAQIFLLAAAVVTVGALAIAALGVLYPIYRRPAQGDSPRAILSRSGS